MKEKLVVTIWKGQFEEQNSNHQIICRVRYGNEERRTKSKTVIEGLVWKQTFLMDLMGSDLIKLDFIRLQQGEQIHFAGEQVADSLAFGSSIVKLNRQISCKGIVPAKQQVKNKEGKIIGKIFIQYELLRAEVSEKVEKQLDYYYKMTLSAIRVNLSRKGISISKEWTNLSKWDTELFYLVLKVGEKQYRNKQPLIQQKETWKQNQPITLFLKKQTQMQISLEMKRNFNGEDNYNEDSYISTYRSSLSSQTKKGTDGRLTSIWDLRFKKNVNVEVKVPLSVSIGNIKKQIGWIQFNVVTEFKTPHQIQELQEQLKLYANDNYKPQLDRDCSKNKNVDKKKNQLPPSGVITINSIIAKIQRIEPIQSHKCSLRLELASRTQQSSIIPSSKQLIFIDTFSFRPLWDHNIHISIYIHQQSHPPIPTYFCEIPLKDFWRKGKLNERLIIKDAQQHQSGELIVDIRFRQKQQKNIQNNNKITKVRERQLSLSLSAKSQEEKEEEMEKNKQIRKRLILERLRKKQIEKIQKQKKLKAQKSLMVPTFSEQQLLLPPLPFRHNIQKKNSNTGSVVFAKSPRFQHQHNFQIQNRFINHGLPRYRIPFFLQNYH